MDFVEGSVADLRSLDYLGRCMVTLKCRPRWVD